MPFFSLDAVLLANFPKIPQKGKIIDLCAGNGAVGLFVAPQTNATIDQVEIQVELAEMGQRSIELNQLEQQVTMYEMDLKDSFQTFQKDSYDLVLCNPPYFKHAPEKKVNPNSHLALARHELTMNLDDVFQVSAGLLKTKGKLALVHRPDRLVDILTLMPKYQLAPKRIQLVYPKAGKDANIVLVEAIKMGKTDGLVCLPPITVYSQDNTYLSPVKEMLYGK